MFFTFSEYLLFIVFICFHFYIFIQFYYTYTLHVVITWVFYWLSLFFSFILLLSIAQIIHKLSWLTIAINSAIWILSELAGKDWINLFWSWSELFSFSLSKTFALFPWGARQNCWTPLLHAGLGRSCDFISAGHSNPKQAYTQPPRNWAAWVGPCRRCMHLQTETAAGKLSKKKKKPPKEHDKETCPNTKEAFWHSVASKEA